MMVKFLTSAVCPLLLAMCSQNATYAGIVLTFAPALTTVEVPLAGTTMFTIDVQMAANTGTQSVRTYNIPVDLLAPAGPGLPQGWSITSVNQQFFGFPEFPPFRVVTDSPPEGDFIVEDGNLDSAVVFTTTPVTLFDFTVSINSTAVPGDYMAQFVRANIFAITDANGALIPANETTLGTASIALRAVPEPSSFGLLTTGLLLVCQRVRRRRR